MSSFRKRGRNKGKKSNFYEKRARATAKKLGHDSGGKKGPYNKRNPNNYNDGGSNQEHFDFTSEQSRKQRLKDKLKVKQQIDEEDTDFGFERYSSGPPRLGWLLNLVQTIVAHSDSGAEQSALDLYFIEETGGMFKATVLFYPYFYIYCEEQYCHAMEQFLRQKFDGIIHDVVRCPKVDLDQKNHLSGIKRAYLKLTFLNENDLRSVASDIRKKIAVNKQKKLTKSVYGESFHHHNVQSALEQTKVDLMAEIVDIREFDVRFITRCCIDLAIRVANWYDVEPMTELNGCCQLRWRKDVEHRPEIKVLAFDIETEKAPLKFPNAEVDRIMMISYMIDNDGYLIVNRQIVSKDIDDFEYTPKPEYRGVFTIFNEDDEEALLRRFFDHIREERPHCYVHYNGDFFDWPFIEKRAFIHGLDLRTEIGVSKAGRSDEYIGRFLVNIDCYAWVSRDSYLPQGSQSLKAVTRKKLAYNPVELDPEEMLPFAHNRPEELATYSVSDAVATYYLFKKYIQDFIFSLCQIIPLNSGDVLRKGTGTLCEALLMVQAYEREMIAPNKNVDKSLKFYHGHLLDSETYIGGTVEAFESGVFRSDIPYKFKLETATIQELIDQVPETIRFFIEVEAKQKVEDVENLEEVQAEIIRKLEALMENDGYLVTEPLIYHLDVAAMYPNIILTNRLQPVAVVDEEICASCDFNRPGKQCQRTLPWRWRGKYFPSSKGEYNQIRAQIEYESFDQKSIGQLAWYQRRKLEDNPNYKFTFSDLNQDQQNELLKGRVKTYSQKVYRKMGITKEEDKTSVICQRENGFYVDTVRNFRDRRYHYKGLTKTWKQKLKACDNEVDRTHCAKMAVMYDSIQLAHKCILNSFYGYVMRRGSRWYNMDMAAITTHIGGNIIRDAERLCQDIGRPIEMDTDGIWTMLPGTFPENYMLRVKGKKKPIELEYPGSMLNLRTHKTYTNHQHQELIDGQKLQYKLTSECSIFFEVDGPYKCMVLPASTEEGRKLKKRYAVFNHDGSLAELKGFEIKRRGELQIIKIFQQEVFSTFLKGHDLESVYAHVAAVGKRWLDVLDTKAAELSDEDLFELITENKNMSKDLAEYGGAKSTAITCAKRLASFLGDSILTGGKLSCKFVISKKPIDTSVSQRAIPVEIFKTERPVMKQYLKRWTKDSNMTDFDIRSILDWDYYRKRVGQNIQKIITIPAAMQKLANPIPTLVHPSWLHKKIAEQNDPYQQKKITSFFTKGAAAKPKAVAMGSNRNRNSKSNSTMMDIEDFGNTSSLNTTSASRKRGNDTTMFLNDSEMVNRTELQDSMLLDSELQDSELQDSMMIDSRNHNRNRGDKENRMADSNRGTPSTQAVTVSVGYEEDFGLWLKQSKALWAQQQSTKTRYRKRKRGRPQSPGSPMGSGRDSRTEKRRRVQNQGADGYFRLQQRLDELYANSWQIIQIVPLEHPGKFALWIYVNGRLRRVKLHVQRPFYVNVNKLESFPKLQRSGKLVTMKLPRNRPMLNLLKIELKEHDFVEQSKQIGMFLTHPDIEGVYETNVPLLFRTISHLGCSAAVSRHTKMANSHSTMGFALDELEFRSTAQQRYLEQSKFDMITGIGDDEGKVARESIKYMFMYHSTANNSNTNNDVRSIFAFIYQRKHQPLDQFYARIIAVNPNKRHKLSLPDLQSYAQQIVSQFELEHHGDLKLTIKESAVKTIAKAYGECNHFLDEYNLMLNGPTILLVQTAEKAQDLYHKLSAVRDHFPMIEFFYDQKDNRYPALQWYPFATQKMIMNWMAVPTLLEQKKGFARYSHIPIGNMPHDVWSYTSDVFFSRLLADQKHLWWISDGCRPDLGGLEEDENLFDDEHFNPTINNPGAYHTFCIELSIAHLATNTVLQSEHIQTLELGLGCDAGAGDMALTDKKMQDERRDNFVKSNIRIDDTSACMASFKILKRLVTNWISDVGATNKADASKEYADRLLMEFYRWLRTPSSLFYDPLLHRMVHRLMKKVFMQLIASFKRFGATIIYASFDRILIETGKNQILNAVSYVDSCVSSIGNQELFEWLTIDATNVWECIVWQDHANYAGYLMNRKEADGHGDGGGGTGANPEDEFNLKHYDRELELRWNIASFLPSYAEDMFDVVVAGYLTDVRNEYRRLLGVDVDGDEVDSLFTQKRNKALEKFHGKKQHKKRKLRQKNGGDKAEMDASDGDGDDDLDIDLDDLSDDDDFLRDEDEDEDEYGRKQKKRGNGKEEMDEDEDENGDGNGDGNGVRSAKGKEVDMLSSELAAEFAKYKRKVIEEEISLKVFEYVRKIKAKLPRDTTNAHGQAELFPFRRGSHLPLQDAALEFVKYLCLVLNLDGDIQEQVASLRKNLLRMVDVGGFSEESFFVDPCNTYILPDVNCHSCKQSRDLDLCRDEFTTPLCQQNEHQQQGQDEEQWDVRCHRCGALYDKDMVEAMLLDVVRRRETAYHVQDVLCATCGKAKVDDMTEYCHCSGQFKNKESRKSFEKSMDVFYNIAQCYQFNFLSDVVEWITRDAAI